MSLRKRIFVGIVLAVLVGFLGAPPVVRAEDIHDPTGTEITFDLVIARPLGFMSLAAGTSIFVVSWPFAVATGSSKKTAKALVGVPYNFTFVRNLGEY
jgi:hypothetical protein